MHPGLWIVLSRSMDKIKQEKNLIKTSKPCLAQTKFNKIYRWKALENAPLLDWSKIW
jgi:hypothetical protein